MKWLTIGIVAVCGALTPSLALSESPLILPKTDFPAHTIIKVYRNVGNIAFDLAQGCEGSWGNPWFHHVCADALNRTGGWVESGGFFEKKDPARQIGFDVVASSFQTPADAAHAYNDFVSTVQGPDWGGNWRKVPSSVAGGSSSSVAEFRLSDPMGGIWGESIIETSGSTETETVSFWSRKRDSVRARYFLRKEMADAIAVGMGPEGSAPLQADGVSALSTRRV